MLLRDRFVLLRQTEKSPADVSVQARYLSEPHGLPSLALKQGGLLIELLAPNQYRLFFQGIRHTCRREVWQGRAQQPPLRRRRTEEGPGKEGHHLNRIEPGRERREINRHNNT